MLEVNDKGRMGDYFKVTGDNMAICSKEMSELLRLSPRICTFFPCPASGTSPCHPVSLTGPTAAFIQYLVAPSEETEESQVDRGRITGRESKTQEPN